MKSYAMVRAAPIMGINGKRSICNIMKLQPVFYNLCILPSPILIYSKMCILLYFMNRYV